MNSKRFSLILICTGLAATSAWANELNVANNGVDSLECGAITNPCRSISQAITNASDYDTIIVGPGRYGNLNGDEDFDDPGEEGGGNPSRVIEIYKPLTVQSRAGAGATVLTAGGVNAVIVWIESNGVTFGGPKKGFTLTNGGEGMVVGGNQIRIEGNVATGNAGNGFYSGSGGDNIVFIDNTASDNAANGFWCDNGCRKHTFTRNVASRNGNEAGFEIAGNGHTFNYNIASNNLGYGFVVWGNDHIFTNNVATGNYIRGFELRGSGHQLRRNMIVGNGDAGINIPGAVNTLITKNNIFGNGGCGLYNDSPITIIARGNYWGAATGPGNDPADQVCGNPVTAVPFATTEFVIPVTAGR